MSDGQRDKGSKLSETLTEQSPQSRCWHVQTLGVFQRWHPGQWGTGLEYLMNGTVMTDYPHGKDKIRFLLYTITKIFLCVKL